jgi:hypothetical protein
MNVCMPITVTSKLLFKSQTAIGFYVKTMSAHDSRFKMAAVSGHCFNMDPYGKIV